MKNPKFTRRSFLGGVLAAGGSVLVAACAGTAPATPTTAPEPTKPAAQPTSAAAQPTPTAAAAAAATPTTAAAAAAAATPTTAAKPTTAPVATPKPATKQATIRWWMTALGDDLEAFKIAPNSFSKLNPGVTFDVGSIAETGLTKVQTAIASGDPPELVLTWDRAGTAGIYYKGGVQVMDDYMKADKDFDAKALVPMSLEGLKSHDGKQFAMPNQIYIVSHLWYNPTMFQSKGITNPPATLDELRQISAMFDVKKGDQLTQVGFHPTAFLNNQIYPFAFGGKFFDNAAGKITPDDPGVIEGLSFLVKWHHDYGVDNLRRLQAGYGQYQTAQNPFLAGQVAMTGFWDALAAYRARYAPQAPMDHAYFPYAASHTEMKGFGMVNFNPNFIVKGSKEQDLAWEVNKFVAMDADSALQMAIALANTPQNLKSLELPAASKADPLLRKAWDYAAKGNLRYFPPSMPGMAEYGQEWSRQVELMLSEKVSVKDGVKAIIDAVQPVVDKALKG